MNREKYLKVPKDRIAIIIGEDGEVLDKIREETEAEVELDSATGEVRVIGQDFLGVNTARDIVKAMARGFTPKKAFNLLKEDYILEIINLKDYLSTNKEIERQKGRVIGTNGKTRRKIEQDSKCLLSIYGTTISIIGPMQNIKTALEAIKKLISGSPHGYIYRFLEEERKKRRNKPWAK